MKNKFYSVGPERTRREEFVHLKYNVLAQNDGPNQELLHLQSQIQLGSSARDSGEVTVHELVIWTGSVVPCKPTSCIIH